MKKVFSLAVVAGLLAFTACSNEESHTEEAVEEVQDAATETTNEVEAAFDEAAESISNEADTAAAAVEGAVEEVTEEDAH